MPSTKPSVTYSLSTSHYYPPGIPNPPSPSGPPPSHSDSPSPRTARVAPTSIPPHWRRVTYTIVAEDLETEVGTPAPRVPFKVKQEAVRKWLCQALVPYLEFKPAVPPQGECQGLEKVLNMTVKRIITDKELVNKIWQLKKCQA